jgi:hypothetical protein
MASNGPGNGPAAAGIKGSRVSGSAVIRVHSHQKDSALVEFFAFSGGYRAHYNIRITQF